MRPQSLKLPFKFSDRAIVAIDIGGSLAKAAIYVPHEHQKRLEAQGKFDSLTQDSIPIELETGDKIYLRKFQSRDIEDFIAFVKCHELIDLSGGKKTVVHATGGGAYKYSELFEKEFGGQVALRKHHEMQSLVDGMSFVLSFAKNPSFTLREGEGKRMVESSGKFGCFQLDETESAPQKLEDDPIFHLSSQALDPDCEMSDTSSIQGSCQKPRLLVSIGSGVSMIKINHDGSFERVSGTMIGGGTLVGLANLLTGVRDFDEIMELAKEGNNSGVDFKVRDIYGETNPFGDSLSSDRIASSFARVANDSETPASRLNTVYSKKDILSSLLIMISYNIALLASLTASRHGIEDIFFVGSYIRNNEFGMARMSSSIVMNSQGRQRALFLTFDGFMGALGALLQEFA